MERDAFCAHGISQFIREKQSPIEQEPAVNQVSVEIQPLTFGIKFNQKIVPDVSQKQSPIEQKPAVNQAPACNQEQIPNVSMIFSLPEYVDPDALFHVYVQNEYGSYDMSGRTIQVELPKGTAFEVNTPNGKHTHEIETTSLAKILIETPIYYNGNQWSFINKNYGSLKDQKYHNGKYWISVDKPCGCSNVSHISYASKLHYREINKSCKCNKIITFDFPVEIPKGTSIMQENRLPVTISRSIYCFPKSIIIKAGTNVFIDNVSTTINEDVVVILRQE